MMQGIGFLYSVESLATVGKFFMAVSEKVGEGEIPPGEDARRIARLFGLTLPPVLEGATIETIGAHDEADENSLRISIHFPVESAATHAEARKTRKCYKTCFSGPLGIGSVCIQVCADCTFKGTSVSCTVTATITAKL